MHARIGKRLVGRGCSDGIFLPQFTHGHRDINRFIALVGAVVVLKTSLPSTLSTTLFDAQ
jgi:hypothetical protein